jgi:hypothetical protein
MSNNTVVYRDLEAEFRKSFAEKLKHKELINRTSSGQIIDFSWLDFILDTLPYMNKIFENPNKFLKNEEEVLNVEKVKKVTTETVKHLAKNSNLINEVENDRVKPSKLLNSFKEETYNTYENRFICTLTDLLESFLNNIENKIKGLSQTTEDKFDFNGDSTVNGEKITCAFALNSKKDTNYAEDQDFKYKVSVIRSDISSWKNSIVYKSLKKEKAQKVTQPLKRTNVILKNPNFQIAAKLWDFVHSFELEINNVDNEKKTVTSMSKSCEKNIVNSILIDYYVMKSINSSNDFQKKKYEQEIKKLNVDLLNDTIESILSSDDEVTKEQLISIVSEKVDSVRVEKKFDYNIISDKIKNSTKSYIDKINGSYFIVDEDLNGGIENEEII